MWFFAIFLILTMTACCCLVLVVVSLLLPRQGRRLAEPLQAAKTPDPDVQIQELEDLARQYFEKYLAEFELRRQLERRGAVQIPDQMNPEFGLPEFTANPKVSSN
jgi:hypothetical protein